MDVNAQSSITINTLMGYNQPLYNMNDDNETSFFTAPNLFFFYLYFFRTLTNPCIGNRQQSNQLHGLVILIIILLNIDIWLVVSNIFFFSISYIYIYMGCHPNPIDELHHFSRWLVNHQPDIRYLPDIKTEHIFLDIGGDVSMEKWGVNGIFVGRQWDTLW